MCSNKNQDTSACRHLMQLPDHSLSLSVKQKIRWMESNDSDHYHRENNLLLNGSKIKEHIVDFRKKEDKISKKKPTADVHFTCNYS